MHELLDAITYLFDVLLTPFTTGSEPQKKWVKVIGLLIAAVGVIGFLGLLAWAFVAPTDNNL